MAGLIEKSAKKTAVLGQPTGAIVDGQQVFTNVPCLVFGMASAQQGFDEYGRIQYGQVFLVAPLAATPVMPGTITVEGHTYTISGVQEYRNLRGVLMGYRIAVAGGA